MQCPRCGSTELRVRAEVTCSVVQSTDANDRHGPSLEQIDGYEPVVYPGSFTQCFNCDHEGSAQDFGFKGDGFVH